MSSVPISTGGGGSTATTSQVPLSTNNLVYTGNNVLVYATPQQTGSSTTAANLLGLVQTLTINRSINRRPVQQVGTGLFADAPPTAIQVTATLQNLIPRASQPSNSSQNTLGTLGIIPSGSLEYTIYDYPFTLFIVPILINGNTNIGVTSGTAGSGALTSGLTSGTFNSGTSSTLWQINGAYFTSDSLTVNETTPISINVSLIARNTSVWS